SSRRTHFAPPTSHVRVYDSGWRMRSPTFAFPMALLLLASSCAEPPPARFVSLDSAVKVRARERYRWSFDEPGGYALRHRSVRGSRGSRTFEVVLGDWAPARGVYRQSSPSSPDRPARVVVGGLSFGDATTSVRCRPFAEADAGSCGVMFRVVDSDNYFVARV